MSLTKTYLQKVVDYYFQFINFWKVRDVSVAYSVFSFFYFLSIRFLLSIYLVVYENYICVIIILLLIEKVYIYLSVYIKDQEFNIVYMPTQCSYHYYIVHIFSLK